MTISRHPLATAALAMTPLQQGMLFHGLREPHSAVYFQQLVVQLAGIVDTGALQRAWNLVVERHEALRMRGDWRQESAVQYFDTLNGLPPFAVCDYRTQAREERDAIRSSFLQADRDQGFDMARPPLMRITLLRWTDEDWDLVWSHHHVLLDGWSSGLVLAEVMQCYDAQLHGRPLEQALVRPYTDFLQWLGQRDMLAADAFWTETLDGFDQPNTLAVLKRNTAQATPRHPTAPMVALERRLDAQEMQALTRVSQSSRVSPASAALACWGLLLGRYSDSEDVVFGVTTSGRPAELAGADRMVGLFINTIPLRVPAPRSNATQGIAEWLGVVQNKLAAARAHEHTALTRIVELSSLTGGQSLFDTIVVYENYPLAVSGKLLGDARIVDVHMEERPSYPLSLVLEPSADGLWMRLLVDTSRIAVEAAERMLGQFEYLVRQLAQSHPDDPVSRLQLLRPEERNTIVQVWNATEHPYDQAATLPGLFLAQAARTPDAVALIDHQGALTYAELRHCVAIVASRLAALDLPPGGPVGVRLGRDRNLVTALLAIVSTGHHYVPLETTWPAERVDAILDTLPIRGILTDTEHHAITSELMGVRAVTLLAVDAVDTEHLTAPPFENRANPHHPAYVIFTSGSTGRPKGVLVHHTKAINLIEWVNRSFGVGPQDRLLFITSPAFDLSVYDIFGVLAAGGSLRIAQEADLADPERLADLLLNGGITFWDSAPAALSQLIPLLPDHAANAKLRLVFLSGDWIPLPLPDQLKRIFPGVRVVALGGATEATIWSNFHVVDAIDPAWVSVPYGRPIQNARYYVLDAGLAPSPIDTPGDLFIGGECLAEGYVGQAELTAERFIPDPFSKKPHARMYRTGDRAKFGSDGVMEFLGRVDTQVKIRGFRIELGEIEVAMRRQAAVSDAICVLHDSGTGGPASGTSERNIIGYFVLRPGHSMSPNEMRHQLAKILPAPMIPAFLLPLDCLPLSSNGKVDRKSLPAPKMEQKTAAHPGLTGDPLRETIAAVWCQVLGLESVAHDENFFELGGHSLRATAVVARLRSTLALDIPLALIFEKPTVLGMAGELRKLSTGDTLFEEPHLRAQDLFTGIPLSRAQQRLWFLHQLEPDNPNYNVALAARVTGNFDIAAFTRAVAAVITRHDILNARIDQRNQQPVMLPMDTDSPLPVEVISLDARSAAQGSDDAMRLLTQASRVPFKLDRERPVRVLLVATAPGLFHVMVLMDHIVTDGWSMGIFAQALFAHYAADVQHVAPPAKETAQYGDFTAWWDQQVEEKLLAKQLAYWKLALADLPKLALPTDHPRPLVASFAGARLPFTLDKVLSAQLRRTALQHGATLFMVLLTAFEVVLRRRSGQDEVVIGTDISGRDHPLSERIIGFFVNQLVLRANFNGCTNFADMLAEVRGCTLDSFYHQHVPFEVLVKELNPVRDSTGTPFFQHKFVLQNAPAVQLQAESFVIEPIDIDTGTSKYDLLLTLIDEDVLRGTLEISTDVFSLSTAQAIVAEFTAVLTQVAADATISYDSLVKTLNVHGDARANLARGELRRSGLQRLRDLTRTGAGTA